MALLEPIGNIPPVESEDRYHAMINEKAMAARSNQTLRQTRGSSSCLK